jgi:hypothetical protein
MIPGVPLETGRVQVDGAVIDAFYCELEEMIKGIPAAIIYNMNETGYSNWADAHEVMVLVPHTYE